MNRLQLVVVGSTLPTLVLQVQLGVVGCAPSRHPLVRNDPGPHPHQMWSQEALARGPRVLPRLDAQGLATDPHRGKAQVIHGRQFGVGVSLAHVGTEPSFGHEERSGEFIAAELLEVADAVPGNIFLGSIEIWPR